MIKKGFTLTELLITLGIIGIIAALTVPSMAGHLIKSKAGGNLAKAVVQIEVGCKNMMQDDFINGEDAEVSYADTLDSMTSIQYNDETIREYMGVLPTTFRELNDFSGNPIAAPAGEAYRFQKFKTDILISGGGGEFISDILIDTNGFAERPNAYGKDVFLFRLRNDGKMIPVGNPNNCTRANVAANGGEDCSSRLIEDHYRVTYW